MASWDDRVLCPDDSCIGVIGPDGACKVCGRVAPNAKVAASDDADGEDDYDDEDGEDGDYEDDEDGEYDDDEDGDYEDDEDDEEADADVEPGLAATAAKPASGDDWDNRELCPDGACTGVMVPGGKCSVCGRTAAEINA
jgi:hypothetical protein